MTKSIDQLAADFAKAAHESIGQRRKYSNAPYFEHPARVAALVRQTGADVETIAAAYLHDVVEDVPLENAIHAWHCLAHPVDEEFLRAEDTRQNRLLFLYKYFGPNVCHLVEQLTDVSQPSDGNRRVRKALDREHTSKASPEAKTVKLADLIDNAIDIEKGDPDFAIVYFKEKAALLEVLKEGDAGLYARATQLVQDFETRRLQFELGGPRPGHRLVKGKCKDCGGNANGRYLTKTCRKWTSKGSQEGLSK